MILDSIKLEKLENFKINFSNNINDFSREISILRNFTKKIYLEYKNSNIENSEIYRFFIYKKDKSIIEDILNIFLKNYFFKNKIDENEYIFFINNIISKKISKSNIIVKKQNYNKDSVKNNIIINILNDNYQQDDNIKIILNNIKIHKQENNYINNNFYNIIFIKNINFIDFFKIDSFNNTNELYKLFNSLLVKSNNKNFNDELLENLKKKIYDIYNDKLKKTIDNVLASHISLEYTFKIVDKFNIRCDFLDPITLEKVNFNEDVLFEELSDTLYRYINK